MNARFGHIEILASYVYSPKFHGSSNHDTDIFYIDSPKSDVENTRTNLAEIHNIINYVNKNLNENIGIITPYKSQIKEFISKSTLTQEILTVHGSQGREWDTVLFSVVDTKNKWFTNSLLRKSNGKNVINTAVSRAKRKLIIVCDYKHWITQKHQLIGQLLSVAKEINDFNN